MLLYAKIAAAVIALGIAYWQGYSTMKDKHLLFVAEVKAVGEAQEAANRSAVEIAEVITESVKENYENQIASLRTKYNSVGRVCDINPNSGKVSAVPKPTSGTYDPTTDSKLIVNCAETTAQLEALQKWVKKQSEVKR
jgi:hypothetical protein